MSHNGVHGHHELSVLGDLHGGARGAGVGLHPQPVQPQGGEVKLLSGLTCTGGGVGRGGASSY